MVLDGDKYFKGFKDFIEDFSEDFVKDSQQGFIAAMPGGGVTPQAVLLAVLQAF